MPCIICGAAATVRSHLVPRGLFKLSAPPDKQMIGSRKAGPGYQYLQSGFWDSRILCKEHEAAFAGPDDYAVRVCRRFVKRLGASDQPFDLLNPHPERLVSFAAACVWRTAVSRTEGQPARWLGPYADLIRDRLFADGSFDPLLLLSRATYVQHGERFNVSYLPTRYSEEGIRFWRFVACGLIFDLKLDNRPTPRAMATLAVNDMLEIPLFDDFPLPVSRDEGLAASLWRMRQRSK